MPPETIGEVKCILAVSFSSIVTNSSTFVFRGLSSLNIWVWRMRPCTTPFSSMNCTS